jgi:hypothetical protein
MGFFHLLDFLFDLPEDRLSDFGSADNFRCHIFSPEFSINCPVTDPDQEGGPENGYRGG